LYRFFFSSLILVHPSAQKSLNNVMK
jgi:hypothetical protein